MPVEVVIPRLGWTMEEATLIEWLKQDGDPVQAGDILFTVESDKALNEVECFDSGVLRIPPNSPSLGSTLPIGALLGFILQPGEEMPTYIVPSLAPSTPSGARMPVVAPLSATATIAPTSAPRSGRPSISPRARRLAKDLGVDWTALQGSGQAGRIVEDDVRAAAEG